MLRAIGMIGLLGTLSVLAATETKSDAQRAWDDLRWHMTALEAYSTDNDSHFAPEDGSRSGSLADLAKQLEWYYEHTFPRKPSPPVLDPWGREYRFVIADSRKRYALYSLGPDESSVGRRRSFCSGCRRTG